MIRRILLCLTLFLLLAIPSGVAWAESPADKVVNADEVIRNDIILFDENFELADGGRVNGDIIIFNGDATIAGTVTGDVVLFNGDLTVETTAVLSGECALFNGSTTGEGADSYSCTSINAILPEELFNFVSQIATSGDFSPPVTSEMPETPDISRFVGGTAAAIARGLLFSLLAFAAASLLPRQMTRIEDALRAKPLASGAVGLLTAFSMPFVLLIFFIVSLVLILACGLGLLGFPIIFVMILAFIAAGFLGWFTVGGVVGEFLGQRLGWKSRTPPLTTALGTAVITFFIGFLGAVPFVFGEGLILVAILFLGLGATTLTKFGTRTYPILAAPALNQEKVTAVLDTLPDKSTLPD